MKKLFFVLAIILLVSCNNNNDSQKTGEIIPSDKADSAKNFFPVTSYLKGQLLELDSLPVTPLYIITKNGKNDSLWIQREQLRSLLQTFLTPIIDSNNLNSYFTETSFNDLSLNAVTLTYEPNDRIPDSMQIRNWSVYIDPEKGIISRIYIVKKIKENGTALLQQLTWETGKFASINTLRIKEDGDSELVKEEKIIWDLSHATE